ncbi:MAG: glycerophosphoryl diester phosphodiesterase membrane domain-containing protein [Clostridiales bacterium]|nr:glycerophosphoryl diester phosphodiesterase membrane domain-containing protein [Clostridiales bacterium]
MGKKEKKPSKVLPYIQSIPEIILYQIVSKLILSGLVFLLKLLLQWSVYKTGKASVSSGDFFFLFTNPYGWLAILTTLLILGVYFAFDINIIVNYAGEKVKERPAVLWKIILESMAEAARFFTPGGILVLLYVTLITPIIGMGYSISLTDNLYIPNFISSIIRENPVYNVLFIISEILMIGVGIFGMFTIHGMIIDHVPAITSFGRSCKMVFRNFWKIAGNLLMFALKFFLIAFGIALVFEIIPVACLVLSGGAAGPFPFFYESSVIAVTIVLYLTMLGTMALFMPLLVMKLTQLYYRFSEDEPVTFTTTPIMHFKYMVLTLILLYLATLSASVYIYNNFDRIFPIEVSSNIIGHRGAGNDAGENTVGGILKAKEIGCYGTEIDIQRTSDGYYVLNHDANFKRVAGDSRKPSDMTLEEIKSLTLKSAPDEKVPTIEEALDAAGKEIILFIELKGDTADYKMADDMVALLKARDAVDNCVLISLKYNLVEYIEDKYPEINTGYLAFITLGDVGALKCDYLGLEEETATTGMIITAHSSGHKVMVWTPNGEASQRTFLLSDADAIITDNASNAKEMEETLKERTLFERLADSLLDGKWNIWTLFR